MIGGLIAGIIIFIIVCFGLVCGLDIGWDWNVGGKILFYLILFLIIVGICIGLGIMIDNIIYDRFIGTWEMTKSNYEQAMSAYSDYESIIKDNPELIKEAMNENDKLANYKYDATRWWYWYIDDSIQNLEPIIIGGTN